MELWMIAVLYLAGLAMMVAETLVPGLVLGLCGVVLVAASIVLGFRHAPLVGALQLAGVLIVGPTAFALGLRRLTLRTTLAAGPRAAVPPSLMGRHGTAATDLRPAGAVLIDGRRVDVVTAGEHVPRGAGVKVVRADGPRIVVESLDGEEAP
jgi:membrane-bound serine protease (ClpP class)